MRWSLLAVFAVGTALLRLRAATPESHPVAPPPPALAARESPPPPPPSPPPVVESGRSILSLIEIGPAEVTVRPPPGPAAVARPPEVTPRPAPAVQRVELEQQRQQWRRQRLISSQISTTLRGLIDLCAGRQLALRPGLRGTLWVMLSLDSPASSDAAALTGLEVTSEEVTVPTFESCLRQRLGDTALPKPISALRLHIPYHLGAPDSADEEDDDDDDSSSQESEGGQSSS